MGTPTERPKLLLFVVLYISLLAISAELCLALMLGLKAFSHMVYVVVSFALLGYGLGSTLYLTAAPRLKSVSTELLMGGLLLCLSILTAGAAEILPYVPINLSMITRGATLLQLTFACVLVASPFATVGFLITMVFSRDATSSGRLYFWDLLGAGLGAMVFFPMISWCGPLRTLIVLALLSLIPAAIYIGLQSRARKAALGVLLLVMIAESAALRAPEPIYVVDPGIGFEWIPGNFKKEKYEEVWRSWHALGRTDLHRMIDFRPDQLGNPGPTFTFDICVEPTPDLCYFTNSYRAGTPVYGLAEPLLQKKGCQLKPFTKSMETPYVLLNRPSVLIIGAGGGRDIFTARVHGASEVVGAEINSATWTAMSPGGVAYDYSGRIYTAGGTTVHNIDGRHLVKNLPAASRDLIILNGIDTFAALSTGAYAFAENYLYTEEAIVDCLKALSPNGVLNMNRWFESFATPRETLRLFLMSLHALRALGVQDPASHIMMGAESGWGILLVKRTPFTAAEEEKVLGYFFQRHIDLIYTPTFPKQAEHRNSMDLMVEAFRTGKDQAFVDRYPYDISVVHDDSPFFYKTYKFNPRESVNFNHPGGGSTAFRVQALIVAQTLVFVLLFIFVPLFWSRRKGPGLLPRGMTLPFIVYFAALGIGFIFIEITLMQRFTLALGSPIYSISVCLAAILVSTGIGSLMSDVFRRAAGSELRLVQIAAGAVAGYLLTMILGGTAILNSVVTLSFPFRILLSSALLAPAGICLGIFFPLGLRVVGERSPGAVAWAWGINSGFTVLGSTVSVILAQFLGFNLVLLSAAVLYGLTPFAYRGMARSGQPDAQGTPKESPSGA